MVYNSYTTVCPPVRVIIHSLKLVDHLLIQADKLWYNDYMAETCRQYGETYIGAGPEDVNFFRA